MAMQPIPGLVYNGHPCSFDDGVATEPPPGTGGEQPPSGTPTPGAGPNAVKYKSVTNDSEDNYWLGKMQQPYKQALAGFVPGSAQLYYDILVNDYGKRYSDTQPSPPGYVKDDKMKVHISNLINAASYNGQDYDPETYTGRLLAIYDQLVVDKKAGLIPPPV